MSTIPEGPKFQLGRGKVTVCTSSANYLSSWKQLPHYLPGIVYPTQSLQSSEKEWTTIQSAGKSSSKAGKAIANKFLGKRRSSYVKQNLNTLWGWRNFTPGISIRKDFQLFSTTVHLWFDEWSKWRMAVKDVKLCGVNVYKGTSPGWCLLKNDEVNFESLIWWLELKIEDVGHSYRRKWWVRQEQKTSTQKRERTEKG